LDEKVRRVVAHWKVSGSFDCGGKSAAYAQDDEVLGEVGENRQRQRQRRNAGGLPLRSAQGQNDNMFVTL